MSQYPIQKPYIIIIKKLTVKYENNNINNVQKSNIKLKRKKKDIKENWKMYAIGMILDLDSCCDSVKVGIQIKWKFVMAK